MTSDPETCVEQRSKWARERPWVRNQTAEDAAQRVTDDLEVVDDEDDAGNAAGLHALGPQDRDFEEFAWLKRVYRGSKSNTWWSNVLVVSLLAFLLMFLLQLGRGGGEGLLGFVFLVSLVAFLASAIAIYRSYELFLSVEPEELTEFSQTRWQSLARTALYFPIYLIVFSVFCAAVGLDGVSTGMQLAYRLNGVVYSLGLYQRMKTLAEYLGSESLQRRIGFFNAPFWVLMTLMAVRLMVEAEIIPLLGNRPLRVVYFGGVALSAMAIYINYYLIMKQFAVIIRSRLLDEAHRYASIRAAYEDDIEDLEEDEEDDEG